MTYLDTIALLLFLFAGGITFVMYLIHLYWRSRDSQDSSNSHRTAAE